MRLTGLTSGPNVSARLRQANTWLLIAWLALAGWTVDALRLFLGMHASLWAGLSAFASHFWYVIPMALAIVALTRLRPPVRLLGIAAYDSAGHLIQHQGSLLPDEITVAGMLSALRSHGQHGLQSLSLPSGASLYFVRAGDLIWMMSFSGPASPREIAASMRQLETTPLMVDLLDGLSPAAEVVVAGMLRAPAKRSILRFFHQHPRVTLGLSGLAYRAGCDEDAAANVLDELVKLGILDCQSACELQLYRLSRRPEVIALLDEVFTWQGQWQTRIRRLEQLVG